MAMRRSEVLAVAVCCVAVLTGGVRPCRGAEHRVGGMRPPTPAEQAYVDSVATRVVHIAPNALSQHRAGAEQEAAKASGAKARLPRTRPAAADNSTLPYFPPIGDQGVQGSCAAWAAAYYYSTFTQAMDEGYDVSHGDYDHISSPGFLYPLINGGGDNGAPISVATARLADIGCASWARQPYSEADCTTWPSEAAWVEAMYTRTEAVYFLDACTPEGLEAP